MGNLRDNVHHATNQTDREIPLHRTHHHHHNSTRQKEEEEDDEPMVGPPRPTTEEEELDPEERKELEKRMRKKDMKTYKKNKDLVEEELVPKKTGREAMIEKKKQKVRPFFLMYCFFVVKIFLSGIFYSQHIPEVIRIVQLILKWVIKIFMEVILFLKE